MPFKKNTSPNPVVTRKYVETNVFNSKQNGQGSHQPSYLPQTNTNQIVYQTTSAAAAFIQPVVNEELQQTNPLLMPLTGNCNSSNISQINGNQPT